MLTMKVSTIVVAGAGLALGLALAPPTATAASAGWRSGAPSVVSTASDVAVLAIRTKPRRPGAPPPRDPSAPVCDGSIAPVVDGHYTACRVRWKAAKPHGRRVTAYIVQLRTVAAWKKPAASPTSWTPVGVGPWTGRVVLSRKARSHVFTGLGAGAHQVRVVARNARGKGSGTYFVAEAGPAMSVSIVPRSSEIFLFDPSVANPDLLVPAVTVRGILRNCDPTVGYSQVVTLVQDGHIYTEWGGHSGYGEVVCLADRTATLVSDPLLDFDGTLHSGNAVVTLTLRSPDDASIGLVVKAPVTIP
jgi:hypothetical protein